MNNSLITVDEKRYEELTRMCNEYFERAIRAEAEVKVLREWIDYFVRKYGDEA